MLVGAGFGARLGFLALLLYLLEGLLGLPFFSGGGSGLSHLAGATGGYLLAFPLAAGLMGWFVERRGSRKRAVISCISAPQISYDCYFCSHTFGANPSG
jgi:biotin transport system substrate-specific component